MTESERTSTLQLDWTDAAGHKKASPVNMVLTQRDRGDVVLWLGHATTPISAESGHVKVTTVARILVTPETANLLTEVLADVYNAEEAQE